MEIAYATDDRFAELACVSMTSVLHNTKRNCRFHVLETRLSDASKQRILKLNETYKNAEWVFHHIDEIGPMGGYTTAQFTLEAYLRIMLPELLSSAEKILYLDCDTIAEGDVAEIWDYELETNLVAAASHPHDETLASRKEILGLGPRDLYFNSGVLLMNLRLMRETHFLAQTITCLPLLYAAYLKSGETWFADQEVLNYLTRGRVLELTPRMNVMFSSHVKLMDNRVGLEEWADTVRRPLIRHFTGPIKTAFLTREMMPYLDWEKYYFYKKLSPYHDTKDDERIRMYKNMEAAAEVGIQDIEAWIRLRLIPVCRAFAVMLKERLGGKRLAFWGNGEHLQTMMMECAAQGVYADVIVDGLSKNQGVRVFHYEVQSPECLRGKGEEYVVVLSTMNRHPAVDKALVEYGFAPENVLHALEPIIAIKEPL